MVIERDSHLSIELGTIDRRATTVRSPDIEWLSVGKTEVSRVNSRERTLSRRIREVLVMVILRLERNNPEDSRSPQLQP